MSAAPRVHVFGARGAGVFSARGRARGGEFGPGPVTGAVPRQTGSVTRSPVRNSSSCVRVEGGPLRPSGGARPRRHPDRTPPRSRLTSMPPDEHAVLSVASGTLFQPQFIRPPFSEPKFIGPQFNRPRLMGAFHRPSASWCLVPLAGDAAGMGGAGPAARRTERSGTPESRTQLEELRTGEWVTQPGRRAAGPVTGPIPAAPRANVRGSATDIHRMYADGTWAVEG